MTNSNITATLVAARRITTHAGDYLRGMVFRDAAGRFEDGTIITTSKIVLVDGPIVHTRNSIYDVTWASDGRSA